jgi:hypothetical protein
VIGKTWVESRELSNFIRASILREKDELVFFLNSPCTFIVKGIPGTAAGGVHQPFIGEEVLVLKTAVMNSYDKSIFVFKEKDREGNIYIEKDEACSVVAGFKKWLEEIETLYEDKIRASVKKAVEEMEEKAHQEALAPVEDNPLFGSW